MSKLYIANTSAQNFVFLAFEPETRIEITHTIRPGQQLMVYEGDRDIIDAMIKPHMRYGMMKADEVLRTRDYVGACYSVDKPIAINLLMSVKETNFDALQARGAELRRKAGQYTIATVDKFSEEYGDAASGITVELEEETDDGSYNEVHSDSQPTPKRRGRPRK